MPTAAAPAADALPWHLKDDRIVWRGALRGCPPSAQHGGACRNRDADPEKGPAASQAPPLGSASRWGAFAALNASRYADVGFTTGPREWLTDPQLCPAGPDGRSQCQKGRLDPTEQLRAKIVLVIDGASFPSNAVWPYLTNSVVMSPLSAYETFADVGMLPWVHFLPVRLDFADAEQTARWCFEHVGRCRAIAEAGRAHMRRCFNVSPGADAAQGHLPASSFERAVEAIIVAHMLANAEPGPCSCLA